MTFREAINEYIERLGCSGKELAEHAGLSAAVISRYRSGERTPAKGSEQLKKLAHAISTLSQERKMTGLSESQVASRLEAALTEDPVDFAHFSENFDALILTLGLNINELARSMSFDASHISRIRLGQRHPGDLDAFVKGVCNYVRRRCRRDDDLLRLAELIGCSPKVLSEEGRLQELLALWLCSGRRVQPDPIANFLAKLDEFDLNKYIRSIHFDQLKVPTAPFRLPTSKTYYGVEQMRAGELDFLKATVLSKSGDPVLMCSDMPLADMAEDLEFGKKWMLGIAMMLKKGLHLDIIHNLDRPFAELMLGLESWIPLYMTGQISPYYLPGVQNNVYCHLNYISGSAVLTGECLAGYHESGKYYLTNNKEELAYFHKKASDLLRLAKPLMEIYRNDRGSELLSFLDGESGIGGVRHGLLSAPPLHTISGELLERLISHNNLSVADAERLRSHVTRQREYARSVLKSSSTFDDLYILAKDDFEKSPVSLPLSEAFFERDIFYTFEEYQEHLRLTQVFAETEPNYTLEMNQKRGFHNIQINVFEGRWAMISKSNPPTIHFIIRYPKLRAALENMSLPVMEE